MQREARWVVVALVMNLMKSWPETPLDKNMHNSKKRPANNCLLRLTKLTSKSLSLLHVQNTRENSSARRCSEKSCCYATSAVVAQRKAALSKVLFSPFGEVDSSILPFTTFYFLCQDWYCACHASSQTTTNRRSKEKALLPTLFVASVLER